jgi:hypothetical protein
MHNNEIAKRHAETKAREFINKAGQYKFSMILIRVPTVSSDK